MGDKADERKICLSFLSKMKKTFYLCGVNNTKTKRMWRNWQPRQT